MTEQQLKLMAIATDLTGATVAGKVLAPQDRVEVAGGSANLNAHADQVYSVFTYYLGRLMEDVRQAEETAAADGAARGPQTGARPAMSPDQVADWHRQQGLPPPEKQ